MMKRLLFTLLCLSVLGTATGCYIDPALSGSTSVEVGVGTYAYETPYWREYPRRRYDSWDDDWRYRRWERAPYRPYRYYPWPG